MPRPNVSVSCGRPTIYSNACSKDELLVGNWSWPRSLARVKGAVTRRTPVPPDRAEQAQANERLTDLEDITGTGVTTPIWSSAGGKDLVSFPRVDMQTHQYKDYDSGGENGVGGDTTRYTQYPAFKQGHGIADFVFLRGGLDRAVVPRVVKIITGNDDGILGINAWYLALFVYVPEQNAISQVWGSGNIAGTLTNQRQAYNIGTLMANTYIQQDHLVAIATSQWAPGIGQSPRSIGCIYQTNIREAAGTTPPAQHMYHATSRRGSWTGITWIGSPLPATKSCGRQ